jgi:hypothetical protein
MEKHEDWVQYWVTQIDINELPAWCLKGVVLSFWYYDLIVQSSSELTGIQNLDPASVLSYLQTRRWRSCVFFNLSVLAFAALIAKIVTNFVTGEPGLAGFRVHPAFDFNNLLYS